MVGLAPVVSPTTDSCCGQHADTLTQSGHLWFLAPLALASCALSGTSRHPASALPWIGLGPDVHVRETPPFVSTLAQRGAFIITSQSQSQSRPRSCSWRGKTRHANVCAANARCKTFGTNVNCKTHLFWAAHLQNVPVQNVECKPCCKRLAVLAFSPNVLHTRSILFVCKISNVNSGLSEIIVSRGIHLDQSPGPVSLHRDADREKKLGGVRRTIKVAPTLRYRHPTTLLRVAA